MINSILQGITSKILVVDDDEDTAESTAQLLRLFGHDVQIARDGHRALEVARSQRPDFVLLDMRMPRLNGYGVAARIRQEVDGPVVIVAITGCGQEKERQQALTAGCNHHFVKPIDPEVLLKLVSPSKIGPLHRTQPKSFSQAEDRECLVMTG